ncbi:hypothetical protein JMJ56_27210 [Belnapia sp. T18]|uniref:Uncharacterized protein n=1 Tax=Belnapia arida TaxID=2804533 RepID=A0ABS1UAI0_9PROT|nr:hypothetical protein [Belnapia arida]MBL6081681.1 hypothetical protein [Belnapia arida]
MVTQRSIFGFLATLSTTVLLTRTRLGAQSTVGLAERRAIAAYRAEKYPAITASIQQVAGFPLPVEVDRDQLSLPWDAAYYARDDYFGNTIFEGSARQVGGNCWWA